MPRVAQHESSSRLGENVMSVDDGDMDALRDFIVDSLMANRE